MCSPEIGTYALRMTGVEKCLSEAAPVGDDAHEGKVSGELRDLIWIWVEEEPMPDCGEVGENLETIVHEVSHSQLMANLGLIATLATVASVLCRYSRRSRKV